jgi:hypothetical protein
MPIHGTLMENTRKEHDNLHQLFIDGVLSACWCECKRCWNSQKVMGICFQDRTQTAHNVRTIIITDEDRRRYGTYRARV